MNWIDFSFSARSFSDPSILHTELLTELEYHQAIELEAHTRWTSMGAASDARGGHADRFAKWVSIEHYPRVSSIIRKKEIVFIRVCVTESSEDTIQSRWEPSQKERMIPKFLCNHGICYTWRTWIAEGYFHQKPRWHGDAQLFEHKHRRPHLFWKRLKGLVHVASLHL